MRIRLYRPADEAAIRAIFERQEIQADLPLPGQDPAVVAALVGENDERQVEMAALLRLCAEAHLVIPPEAQNGARKIMRLRDAVDGALLVISREMQLQRLGAILDMEAHVPLSKPRMLELMPILGFQPEPAEFKVFWRKIGST